MTITFKNGYQFDYMNAIETEEYYNGSNRRTLTFECPKGLLRLDEINSILSNEENTEEIILTNDEDPEHLISNTFSGYVLKLSCGIESKLFRAETSDSPAVYDDVFVFKLGKRTFVEESLHKMGIM